MELVLDTDTVWIGFVMMMVWTVAVVAEAGWELLKGDPTAGGKITGVCLSLGAAAGAAAYTVRQRPAASGC
jgi:hypothetical protein